MSEKQIDLDAMRKLANETRARADAAHKGPWHIHEGDLVDANHKDVFDDWEEVYGPNEDEVGPDTAFICAAQQDVVHLTDAVGIAAAEIEHLRKDWEERNHRVGELADEKRKVLQRRDDIITEIEQLHKERDALLAFIQGETDACTNAHLGGPCGACARRIEFLTQGAKPDA